MKQKIVSMLKAMLVISLLIAPSVLIWLPSESHAELTKYDVPRDRKTLLDEGAQKLTDITWSLTQNGTDDVAPGNIEKDKPIEFRLNFKAPIKANGGGQIPISRGDTASIKILDNINLGDVSEWQDMPFKQGKVTVGHVSVENAEADGKKSVVLKFIFDGEEKLFDGRSEEIEASAELNFELGDFGGAVGTKKTVFFVMNKGFTLKPGEDSTISYEPEPRVTKKGTIDRKNKLINWTVTVEKDDGRLIGYSLEDDLSTVGKYIDNSFNLQNGSGSVQSPAPVYNDSEKKLSYTFTQDSLEKITIKFQTELTGCDLFKRDESYIDKNGKNKANGQSKNRNIPVNKTTLVVIKSPEGAEVSAPAVVKEPEAFMWINYYHAYATGDKNVIVIEVNQNGDTLENVVATALLSSSISIKKAILKDKAHEPKDEGTGTEISLNDIAKEQQGEKTLYTFNLGNIDRNKKLALFINYKNGIKIDIDSMATVTWDGRCQGAKPFQFELFYDNTEYDPGQDPYYPWPPNMPDATKSGSLKSGTDLVEWTVDVHRGDYDVNVCDLFIFDSNVTSADGLKVKAGEGPLPQGVQISDVFDGGASKQRLIEAPSGSKVYKIVNAEGIHVGDLVYSLLSDSAQLKYKAKILPPYKIEKKEKFEQVVIKNNVWYHDGRYGGEHSEEATVKLNLDKKLLSAQDLKDFDKTPSADIANRNLVSPEANKTTGYSYSENAIIYKIFVNNKGNKDIAKLLGDFTIEDKLPEGWSFAKFKNDKEYLVFKAAEGEYKAEGDMLDPSSVNLQAEGAIEGQDHAKFKITGDELPGIVIFLKAVPSEETLKAYAGSKWNEVENTAKMTAKKFPENYSIEAKVPDYINLRTKILSKYTDVSINAGTISNLPVGRRLNWSIDYKPMELMKDSQKVSIIDTLGYGLSIPLTADRKPDIDSGYYKLYERVLDYKGSFTATKTPVDIRQDMLTYDSKTKKMELVLPDKNKCYTFEYVVVVGKGVASVANTAMLKGSCVDMDAVGKQYRLKGFGVRVKMKTSIPIEKKWVGTPEFLARHANDEVKVKLKNPNTGDVVAEKTVKKAGKWKAIFTNIAIESDGEGNIINYIVEEDIPADADYKPVVTGNMIEGFVITNRDKTLPDDPGKPSKPKKPKKDDPNKPKPEDPKPPVDPPVTPPDNPTPPPSDPPVTPPSDPNPPSEPPATPPAPPRYPPSNPPDPNDPNSPDIIEIVGDDGVPLGRYKKVPTDDGGFEYIDEEGVPLGNLKLVGTGNEFPELPLTGVAIVSLLGIAFVLLRREGAK